MRKFSLIIFALLIYILFGCGCRSDKAELHNAIQLITFADSLRSEGVLFTDTTKIKHAIDVLEHSFPRQRDLLGKAYFLMGRNYDVLHMDTKEVHWFVKCIEMKGADIHTKKRSMIHLMNICMHQNHYNSAEQLIKKEISLLLKHNTSKRDIGIAQISLANIYIAKKDFKSAIEIIDNIASYLPDSILSPYYYNSKLSLYKEAHNSDSAEYYAKLCLNAHNININGSRAPYLLQIAEIKEQNHLFDSALLYTKHAIKEPLTYTDSMMIKDIAYHVFIKTNDEFAADLFKKYYNNNTITHKPSTEEAQAAILIDEFYNNTLPSKIQRRQRRYLYIIFSSICMICIAILLLKYRHKIKNLQQKYIVTKTKLNDSIDIINTMKSANKFTEEEKDNLIETTIAMYKSLPIWETAIWKDEKLLEKELNTNLNNLGYKLKRKSVSFSELRLCILLLCHCGRNEISDKAYISINSIEKYKSRLATKLEIPRSNIYDQIIKIIKI